MSTLTNVDIEQSCEQSRGIGIQSITFPQVRHSQTGESVDYTPDPTTPRSWYVFRVTHNQAIQAADSLIQHGVYAYVATTEAVIDKKEGGFRVQTVPLINLVFAFLTRTEADDYVRGAKAIPHLTYYYNHFATIHGQLNPPLTVDGPSVLNFILATHTHNRHVRLLSKDELQNRIGQEVRVTHGEFQGVQGRLARIAGQQRVVIDVIDGMFIATAYVPTAFLQFTNP